jgi:transcriptional regulator with XRE-family HTH domain
MDRIYQTLKYLRKKNQLTQQDLADYLNLDVSSVSKLESGKIDISLSKLELLSKKYDMTVIELLAYPNKVVVNDKNEQIINLKAKVVELLELVNKME